MSPTQFLVFEQNMKKTRRNKLQKMQIYLNRVCSAGVFEVRLKIDSACANEHSGYVATM